MMQQTSLQVYKEVILPNIGTKQRAVYDMIKICQPISDKGLCIALYLPINEVTPRRGELVKMGLIKDHDVKDRCMRWVSYDYN